MKELRFIIPKDSNMDRPVSDETFEEGMKKIVQFAIDYYNNPEQYSVTTDIKPHEIFRALPSLPPENSESFEDVWNDFRTIIMDGLVHWNHPRFHAFFSSGRSYPDILAETLISSLGIVGFNWDANPIISELDSVVVNWLGRAFDLPESFLFQGDKTEESPGGGYLADTASDSIFCAVMAARHIKVKEVLSKKNNNLLDEPDAYVDKTEIISKLVAYGSKESHSSFEKACKMAVVRCQPINTKEKYDYGMVASHVEKAFQKDIECGLIPFYLHIAIGTTSTASSDHMNELGKLGKKYGVWIHVDAAYAGSFWIEPKFRDNAAGLEFVDSININLHKQFLISCSVTAFWTRRQKEYKDCFNVSPVYLKKKNGTNDLRDWGVQLSRRFKSLKVWFVLRMYGVSGMRTYVNRLVTMANYMESKICGHPNIKKFGKTILGMFCVQYVEPEMTIDQVNYYTKLLCEYMNESHQLLFTHSVVQGNDIIRIVIAMERTTEKDVDKSVEIFFRLLEQFKIHKDDEDLLNVKNFTTMNSRDILPYDMDNDINGSIPYTIQSSNSSNSLSSMDKEQCDQVPHSIQNQRDSINGMNNSSNRIPTTIVQPNQSLSLSRDIVHNHSSAISSSSSQSIEYLIDQSNTIINMNKPEGVDDNLWIHMKSLINDLSSIVKDNQKISFLTTSSSLSSINTSYSSIDSIETEIPSRSQLSPQ